MAQTRYLVAALAAVLVVGYVNGIVVEAAAVDAHVAVQTADAPGVVDVAMDPQGLIAAALAEAADLRDHPTRTSITLAEAEEAALHDFGKVTAETLKAEMTFAKYGLRHRLGPASASAPRPPAAPPKHKPEALWPPPVPRHRLEAGTPADPTDEPVYGAHSGECDSSCAGCEGIGPTDCTGCPGGLAPIKKREGDTRGRCPDPAEHAVAAREVQEEAETPTSTTEQARRATAAVPSPGAQRPGWKFRDEAHGGPGPAESTHSLE